MKKTIKKILIILGSIMTIYTMLQSLIDANFSISTAIDYYLEYFMGLLTLYPICIITVLGPLLIIIGAFINTENQDDINPEEKIKKIEKKYKTLIFIGTTPFIGVILSGIMEDFSGDSLIGVILLYSIILWPLYIIGIIMIIIGIIKIKTIKK